MTTKYFQISDFQKFLVEARKTEESFLEGLKIASFGSYDAPKWTHYESLFDHREKHRARLPIVLIVEAHDFYLEKMSAWCVEHLGVEDGLDTAGQNQDGKWAVFCLGKTDYDYFFVEYYFLHEADAEAFKKYLDEAEDFFRTNESWD